jgi:hypothetical protein
MGMPSGAANNLWKLLLQGVGWSLLADNTATTPLTNLYVGLHTADPSGGNQTTNEVSYTGYTRATVARSSSGFTVTTNQATFAAQVNFPPCTGGTATATFFSIGTALSGAGTLIVVGTIPSLSILNGITPGLTTGTVISET